MKPTLSERLDRLIYSDCEQCRGLRFAMFAGAVISHSVLIIAILLT